MDAAALVKLEAVQELGKRLKQIERDVAKQMRPGRGRPWNSPDRPPAAQGRDALVVALQRRGLTFRKAQEVVTKFWNVLAEGLRRDRKGRDAAGSPADTLQRRGRKQVHYTQPRMRFRPSWQLSAACKAEEIPVKPVSSNQPVLREVWTGAVHRRAIPAIPQHPVVQTGRGFEPGDGTTHTRADLPVREPHPAGAAETPQLQQSRKTEFPAVFCGRQKFWESTQPAAIIQKLLQDRFATQQQYDVLADRVAFLNTLVEELQQRPAK